MLVAAGTPFDLGAIALGGTQGEVALLGNGNLFVVWANTVNPLLPAPGTDAEGTTVVGRIFSPTGTAVTDAFQINMTEPFFQQHPEVTVLNNGNVVVAWTDTPFGAAQTDAQARIYAPDGSPVTDEFLLASITDGDQRIPQVAATPDGGFLAVWNDGRAESFGQYFDASGAPLGAEFVVPNDFGERLSSLVVLDDGSVRYIVAEKLWTSDGSLFESGGYTYLNVSSTSTFNNIYEALFDTAMTQLTGTRYATAGVVETSDGIYQVWARVRDASNFDNLIQPESTETGVYVALSSDIPPIAGAFKVEVDLAPLSNGGFVAVWAQLSLAEDGFNQEVEVRARVVGPDMALIGDEVTLYTDSTATGIQVQPFVTEMANGQVFVGWSDTSLEVSDVPYTLVGNIFDVEGVEFVPPGSTTEPTEYNDTLIGTEGDDAIAGMGGDDLLYGLGGNDSIAASSGRDTVYGGDGDDQIGGGTENDSINGGAGNDTIGSGQGDDVADGGDGDDIVNGGAGDDTLSGGAGDDVMGASFGADVLNGGSGNDDMGGGTGSDRIDGGEGNDSIGGGEGNDTIDGSGGDDFLAGGGRHDYVNGGTGNDTINGGAGNDTMSGAGGDDVFVFNSFSDGEMDVINNFEDGADSFRMTGVENAPGTGLAGKVAALNITDIQGGVLMTYEGHTIEVQGITAADLTAEDFVFV